MFIAFIFGNIWGGKNQGFFLVNFKKDYQAGNKEWSQEQAYRSVNSESSKYAKKKKHYGKFCIPSNQDRSQYVVC